MFDIKRFEMIREKHGRYASWAIWEKADHKPKSNVGNIQVLDPSRNNNLLNQVNPHVIMVGLNISREVFGPLANFHDPRSRAMDFKIRHAFEDTPYYGAYMTDIIKDFEQKMSGKVIAYLKIHPDEKRKNIELFRDEIKDLDIIKPIMLAFGKDAHKILLENLSSEEYEKLIRLPHYSNAISKEKYRIEVANICGYSMNV